MTSVTEELQTIEIKGTTYGVERIDPGFAGVAAVRLIKLASADTCYDVVRQDDGLIVCDCPDFVVRHEGKGTCCKHGKAAVAAGLLETSAPVASPTPAPVKAPASFAPITRKDLVRASYFGLRLPAGVPMAVEPAAPAPTETEADEDLGPIESDPAIDLAPFVPSFTVVGDEVEVFPPATLEPRPVRSTRFEPTPEEHLWWAGFTLGMDGEDARAPKGRSFPELVAFYEGLLEGRAEREAEFDAWLNALAVDRDRQDEAFGGPAVTWNAAELAECGSCSGHPAFEG